VGRVPLQLIIGRPKAFDLFLLIEQLLAYVDRSQNGSAAGAVSAHDFGNEAHPLIHIVCDLLNLLIGLVTGNAVRLTLNLDLYLLAHDFTSS
jgi:hypothetical protein